MIVWCMVPSCVLVIVIHINAGLGWVLVGQVSVLAEALQSAPSPVHVMCCC
jgi:hypothetical protein